MKIRWTIPTADDLEDIFNYLQQNPSGQARSTAIEIRRSVRSLKQFPYRGGKGRQEGTRELPHPRLPYILTYRITGEVIEILHIWHGARNRT